LLQLHLTEGLGFQFRKLFVLCTQFDCSGSVLEEVPFKMYEAFLFYLQGLGYGMWTVFLLKDTSNSVICNTSTTVP